MTTTLPAAELAERGAAVAAAAERRGATHEETSEAVLHWAGQVFGDRITVLSSMGDEVMVHLASVVLPGIDVAFLDTGYHFPETLGTRDAFAATRPINLINIVPALTVPEQDAHYGARLYERDPDLCCQLRKVEPLNRALRPYRAWITGMRREDSPARGRIGLVELDSKRDMVKINPLAAWTLAEVQAYAARENVLLNPLRQIGYTSIGCAPCTRVVAEGEDARAGRWSGTGKTECGLHT